MKESQSGYYRSPDIYEDRIIFVAEDDLWEVAATGGRARRLTTNLGTPSNPQYSPDGQWIAFVGTEQGQQEVYVMPAQGGPARRVTFLGENCRVVGWDRQRILFSSTYALPVRHWGWLYSVEIDGTDLQRLNYGPANRFSKSKQMVVLGRHIWEQAWWKRYRGGRAGELLIDPKETGQFHHLIELDGNLADPMIIDSRVYFLSDHNGIANLYSCLPDGGDLQQHTNHDMFYARNANTDGKRIVYHAGAEIYVFDPAENKTRKVDIHFDGARAQTSRKFVKADKYLEDYSLSSDGAMLEMVCRGKAFNMGCWEGPVIQQGQLHGIRYRLARILNDGRRIIVASDAGGEDHLEIHSLYNDQPVAVIEAKNLGRPMDIKVSPQADEVLVVNHRHELWRVNLETNESILIDRNKFYFIHDFNWSPDGRWAAYDCCINARQTVIKIYNTQDKQIHIITRPVLHDRSPVFDPEGKYLYFLSARVFDPVYDKLHFDLGFPQGMRPYAICLRKDVNSPFVATPEGFGKKKNGEKDTEEKSKDTDASEDSPTISPIDIDFDGIEDRIVAFPAAEGIYEQIGAASGRIFYTLLPVKGSINNNWFDREPKANATLNVYDLKKREESTLSEKISSFSLSRDGSAIAIRVGKRLRVVASDKDKLEENDKEYTRKTGWIDLNRVKVDILPREEWRQMLTEAWRLQRDYFWVEDMSGVEWQKVLDHYLPLADRVSSRSEFADLVWEMQGELGTSHAYELGGDYREKPNYQQGFLGADMIYDSSYNAWRIEHIVAGDCWDPQHAPPLLRPGTNICDGMLITAVAGRPVDQATSPQQLLVNQADQEVSLTVAQPDGSDVRNIVVKTLKDESKLRYREWVEQNRKWVLDQSSGRVGYVHIPDMGPWGYAEFHRYFLIELDYDGLIIDVRYNSGGHVAQLLLEKLMRRRLGCSVSRWMAVEPYPYEAPKGPMVCLTNESAGSDGDIISQAFKQNKLGPLIGRRTLGGVVGISPQNSLVDGTVTTQPESAYWFKEVGWSVENHGVDPDIDVSIMPQDWAIGKDPQLDRALKEVLRIVEKAPQPQPDMNRRPNLSLP